MKNIKYFLLILVIALSFYLTDKVMIHMENKNPIMKEIHRKEFLYKTLPVNAVIKDNTIVPGVNGKNVDKRKSLVKMNEFGSFNETFLIYQEIKPDISLKDNLDKVIREGNPRKRSVSFIIVDNKNIEDYFIQNKLKYSILANLNTKIEKEKEYLLGELSENNISDLNALLTKNKVNSKICVIGYANINYCKDNKYYLVDPRIKTPENINVILSNLKSGSMIMLNRNFSVDNLRLIISEINKQDLKIVYLSELISESN